MNTRATEGGRCQGPQGDYLASSLREKLINIIFQTPSENDTRDARVRYECLSRIRPCRVSRLGYCNRDVGFS